MQISILYKLYFCPFRVMFSFVDPCKLKWIFVVLVATHKKIAFSHFGLWLGCVCERGNRCHKSHLKGIHSEMSLLSQKVGKKCQFTPDMCVSFLVSKMRTCSYRSHLWRKFVSLFRDIWVY